MCKESTCGQIGADFSVKLSGSGKCLLIGKYRNKVFSNVNKGRLLEVGVGTGKNIRYYPDNVDVTAIDFSPEMIKRAQKKASDQNASVNLKVMDVEALQFEDNSFDTVVSTCVFCSVPDPVRGFSEVCRVLKPGGVYYALEHVRPKGKLLGALFDNMAPIIAKHSGVHINRNTGENIKRAGFVINTDENLVLDILKFYECFPCKPAMNTETINNDSKEE